MNELEGALEKLGDRLAFPEVPDVSARVVATLDTGAGRRGGGNRLAVALALLAAAVGTAFAVPQARGAILDFFGLRGATVQRVETLPRVPPASERTLGLGEPVPLADGHLDVGGLRALVPAALGLPDAAYVSKQAYGERLALVYGPGDGVPASSHTGVGILVTEFAGRPEQGFVEKMGDAGSGVERVEVGSHPALWLEGGPHAVLFRGEGGETFDDRGRLAGNTLLVDWDGLLVRIEGELDRDRAIALAASLSR